MKDIIKNMKNHIGHHLTIKQYSGDIINATITLECEDCDKVIINSDDLVNADNQVIVKVFEGLATVTTCPNGINVTIQDHDNKLDNPDKEFTEEVYIGPISK
jgi:hypothetical protein